MTAYTVAIGLGSNLGDRRYFLAAAVRELQPFVRVVRLSSMYETEPLDSSPEAGSFLNLVAVGATALAPHDLLRSLVEVEKSLGRSRRFRNEPRTIDIDLIFYGAVVMRSRSLELPHARYAVRNFVIEPLRELQLPWVDPGSGRPLERLRGAGRVMRAGRLY